MSPHAEKSGPAGSIAAEPTPGEWKAQRSRIVGSDLWTVSVGNVLLATTKDPFTDDIAVTETNARLMAAAKNMLAVMKKHEAVLTRRAGMGVRTATISELNHMLADFRAAIAKAEGRPQ